MVVTAVVVVVVAAAAALVVAAAVVVVAAAAVVVLYPCYMAPEKTGSSWSVTRRYRRKGCAVWRQEGVLTPPLGRYGFHINIEPGNQTYPD